MGAIERRGVIETGEGAIERGAKERGAIERGEGAIERGVIERVGGGCRKGGRAQWMFPWWFPV